MEEGGPVVEMVDLSHVQVEVPLPERYVSHIQIHDPVTATFDGLPAFEAQGRVFSLVAQADRTARTFPVKVEIPNPALAIKSGMVSRVTLRIDRPHQGLVVPKDALVLRGGKAFVFRVNEGTVDQIPVTAVLHVEDLVEIEGPGPSGDGRRSGRKRTPVPRPIRAYPGVPRHRPMNVIQFSIRYPVTTSVAVILVVLFGLVSLMQLPIQLTPDVSKPEITVSTRWQGASPKEVEREIVDKQEEQLKGVEGLEKMFGESAYDSGEIILRFPAGTNTDTALLRVSNRLNQVKEYPDEVDEPVISSADTRGMAMGWFIFEPLAGNPVAIDNPAGFCGRRDQGPVRAHSWRGRIERPMAAASGNCAYSWIP